MTSKHSGHTIMVLCPTLPGLETAVLKSISLLTFFALTLPSPGRVEEEINNISTHPTPKIPPLHLTQSAPRPINYLVPSGCKKFNTGNGILCRLVQFPVLNLLQPLCIFVVVWY